MYESFYKLNAKPFALNPDPRFFFGSRTHKRAMSYLRYGLTQGEGFIVITGDVGAGKTILVRTLFAGLAKENVIAAQLVTTHLDADEMLKMVAASFGLAHEGLGKASLLKNLETFLITRTREGKRVLLVIDEAQNLPRQALEELRMLSNYELAGKILLQSFLLGQAEFRNHLQDPEMEQLRQRVIAAYHLTPLGVDETKGYIEHRLGLVSWEGNPHFTDGAYQLIHGYTRGIPRRINQLCDRLLLYGYLEEQTELTEQDVTTVAEELEDEVAHLDPKPVKARNKPDPLEEPVSTEERPAAADDDRRTDAETADGAGDEREVEKAGTRGTKKRRAKTSSTAEPAADGNSMLLTGVVDEIGAQLNALEARVNAIGEAVKAHQDRLRLRNELEEHLGALEERMNAMEAALRRQQDRLRQALLSEEEPS